MRTDLLREHRAIIDHLIAELELEVGVTAALPATLPLLQAREQISGLINASVAAEVTDEERAAAPEWLQDIEKGYGTRSGE